MDKLPYAGFKPWLLQTLLGSALPVSEHWADMFEPWQPDVEKRPNEPALQSLSLHEIPEVAGTLPRSSPNSAGQAWPPSAEQERGSESAFGPVRESKFLDNGTETLSDAPPDPVLVGQQYAAGGSSGRPSRRGGLPETPVGRLLSGVYEGKLRTLAEIEPTNENVTQFRAPDWRPRQSDIDKIDLEIILARQRAPGASDTQASGIGIGPYARESIPARSEKRNFTEQERAEIARLGYRHGCHTCGTRDPGTTTGNFTLDHQRPTRLNPYGEGQRVLPQCMSCMQRQGGLIAREVTREKP
jgi:hypothetical protein